MKLCPFFKQVNCFNGWCYKFFKMSYKLIWSQNRSKITFQLTKGLNWLWISHICLFWHLGHSVYYFWVRGVCLIHHQIYGLVNQMSYNTFQVMFVLFPHVSIHSYIFWKSIKYHTWYFFSRIMNHFIICQHTLFFIRTMFSTPSLGVLW